MKTILHAAAALAASLPPASGHDIASSTRVRHEGHTGHFRLRASPSDVPGKSIKGCPRRAWTRRLQLRPYACEVR